MRTGTGSLLAVLAASALAACDGDRRTPRLVNGPAPAPGGLVVRDGDASATFAWIDGSVVQAFRARVTADREQTVVRTGFAPGGDQGKVLVFDDDGSRALDFAVPYATPFVRRRTGDAPATRLRQAMVASEGQVIPFESRGRRLLLIGTAGRYGGAAMLLLEAGPPGASREILRFWNEGSIRHVCASPTHIALFGVNNALDRSRLRRDLGENYTSVAAIFAIPRPEDVGVTGRSPRDSGGTSEPGEGYGLYVRLPMRQIPGKELREFPRFVDGKLRMLTHSGVVLTIDPETGEVTAPGLPAEDASLLRVWRR